MDAIATDRALTAAERDAEAQATRKPGRPKGTPRAVVTKQQRRSALLHRLRAAATKLDADAVCALADAYTDLVEGTGETEKAKP